MKAWPLDIHGTVAAAAAVTASVGLLFAFNSFTVVAAYCMVMYAIYPTLLVHEIAALVLSGFVFQAPMSTAGAWLYCTAYALFLTAIPIPRMQTMQATQTTTPVVPPINADDI